MTLKTMMKMSYCTVILLTYAVSFTGSTGIRFLVLGDWGGLPFTPYRTFIERDVAKAMNSIASEYNTSFQVALGDNFYFDGVKDVHDKRFKDTFEDVFTGSALQTNWYFIGGNHDWHHNISAQIAYSQVSNRWNFPNYYYTRNFKSPDGATAQLVLFDTVMACGLTSKDFKLRDLPPKGPECIADAEEQWQWIEKTLSESKADYLLVGGHYPVYSISSHGPTDLLIQRLKPVLYRYNVTASIAGHDHNLQHIQEKTNSTQMDYFVIGSANFIDPSRKHESSISPAILKFFDWCNGGFALMEFNKTMMSLTFVSHENKELYKHTMMPRK